MTRQPSKLEATFSGALAMFGRDLPPHRTEYHAIPGRELRWDFAWPEHGILLEIQGGIFSKGRSAHSGASLVKDFLKNNLAVEHGWRVLYLSPKDMRKRVLADTVDGVRRALAWGR